MLSKPCFAVRSTSAMSEVLAVLASILTSMEPIELAIMDSEE